MYFTEDLPTLPKSNPLELVSPEVSPSRENVMKLRYDRY